MATDLLDALRSRIGASHLITSCGGRGCRVDMAGVPAPYVIVDADKAFPAHGLDGPRCDRVLFLLGPAPRRLVSAPIELKSGGLNASHVADQLQDSIEFVNRVAPPSALLACRPILVHGHGLHPKQRKALGRIKIRFRSQRLTIATARCSRPGNLATALQMRRDGRGRQ